MVFTVGLIFTLLAVAVVSYFITRYLVRKLKFAWLWSFQRRRDATRGGNSLASRNATSTRLTPATAHASHDNINRRTNNSNSGFNNNGSRGRTDTAVSVSASSSSVASEADSNQNNSISLFDDIEEILAGIRLAAASSPIDSLPPEARREYVSNVLIVKRALPESYKVLEGKSTNDVTSSELLGDHVFLSNLRDDSDRGSGYNIDDKNDDNNDENTDKRDVAHQAEESATNGVAEIPPVRSQDNGDVAVGCVICLCEYQVGDDICFSHNRRCAHHFHSACITEWLVDQQRVDCPCCRNNYLALSDDDEDDDDGGDHGSDAVGNVLARQPDLVTPSSTSRVTDNRFNRRHRHRDSRGSITRSQSATILEPAPPSDNSSSTPTASLGTVAATSIRGEDPWTGVPLQFFDHQFSNALRPYRNDNSAASHVQANPNTLEQGNIRRPERIQREFQTFGREGDYARSNNSSVYTEDDSRQLSNIEQQLDVDPNSEDETDMWSCGPSAETEDDIYLLDDDPSRNLTLRPRWSRRRRRGRPQPSASREAREQEPSSANFGGAASVSLELSDLIVEGLMQRLEENNRSDDERSSRTESSGSVYLQGTVDSDDEEAQVGQNWLSAHRGGTVEPPYESNTDVCAICRRHYGVNEELCWSQDPRCVHVFHTSCMENWIVDHDECPFCAASWTQSTTANEDGEADAYLLQVLHRLESQANTMPSSQDDLEDGNANIVQSCNSNERIDRPNEGITPSHGNWIDEECAVALDGDNSLGMSIGSWTTTSDVVIESTVDKAETAAAQPIEDPTVISEVPIDVPSGSPNSVDTLEAHVDTERALSHGQESALFEEWGLVIDAFARMNERILNSQLDNIVSTKKTPPNDDEGFSGGHQDVG